jgi:hypothetical protein
MRLVDENALCVKSIAGFKRIPLEDAESWVLLAWHKDSAMDVIIFVREAIKYRKSQTK